MLSIAARFTSFLADLRVAVAAHAPRNPQRAVLFGLLWGRLGRMASRFETLFAKWQAGTLPKPRPSRPGQPRKPRDPQPRIPQGRVWLVAAVGHHAAGRASQLQHLFTDPDFDKFLAAAPQAGRILRPLCHMLGIDPPPPVRLPPRIRPPRDPKPRRSVPPPFNIPLKRPRLPPIMFPARRISTA